MESRDLRDASEAAFAAYRKRHARNDLEGVLELFSSSAVVEDPVGTPVWTGLAEIRSFYSGTYLRNGTMRVDPVGPALVGGDELVAHVRAALDAPGSPPAMGVICVIRFAADGKIESLRAWY